MSARESALNVLKNCRAEGGWANGLLKEQLASVQVLPTEDAWFGMTYQEDKPRVAAALRQLHEKGTYPKSLR